MPEAKSAPISIIFTNKLTDHLEAQRVLYRKGVLAKLDKVVAVLLFCFGVYGIILVGLHWWTVIWFPLAVAEWFNLVSLSQWRTKIEFQRNPKFREEYHLTFSREHIQFKTVSIDSTLQWTHYEHIIESPDLFLLMYGKGLYTLIPKRCFRSTQDINAFRDLLSQTIGL
ncbi:YcxB family protein [Chamaesiphon sp. VAR_48_metabat_403]|uniref:YcxB family protein n=1 Tax=Chamaesiphon sp. VAR_48_metabat_403 TaxID=2964700 RepID=UPI00286E3254|nr:YcxB family protein [Chamaesiphon sp. VAR_48_metabat_403]